MVSFIVRLKFAPEDSAVISAVLRQLATESRREQGCISYDPHQVEGEPGVFLIYEQYRDEPALYAHQKSEHYKKYAIGALYQKMTERSTENLAALL